MDLSEQENVSVAPPVMEINTRQDSGSPFWAIGGTGILLYLFASDSILSFFPQNAVTAFLGSTFVFALLLMLVICLSIVAIRQQRLKALASVTVAIAGIWIMVLALFGLIPIVFPNF
jgi:hypothetical protein